MSGIAITFTSSPVEGQSYLAQNGFTYIYDSQKNRWKRGGEFVRSPKVLSYAGVAATTAGSGITTGPTGALIYNVPGFVVPNSTVGVDSYKAYRTTNSYPDYTEVQVSISSDFSSVAYAATFTGTTHTVPATTLSGDLTYYLRARQFVGSSAASASTGAISGYSPNIVSFATTSVYLDTPTIVSIAGTSTFPVYQIGFAGTTLPATVTYFGSGVGNLEKVEWRVTGPRNPDSTGDTALAEVGIGTLSSVTLANSLVLALPFSGATGVGITDDVNGAIRTASGASAGTTKTVTANGGIGTTSIVGISTLSHFYSGAAYFDGTNDFLEITPRTSFEPTGNTPFTFETWIYPRVYNDTIFGTYVNTGSPGTGGERGFLFDLNSTGQIAVFMRQSFSEKNVMPKTVNSIPLNTWTHVAIQIGAQTDIYFNGLLQSTTVTYFGGATFAVDGTSNPITSYHASAVTYLGANIGTGTTQSFLNGYVQDVKIYNGLRKYQENFTPPLPTYGTISYTTSTIGSVGIATTAFLKSTGDIPTAEVAIGSSTAAQVASSLVLALPMNRTFGFQDISVAVRGLTSGASAGTAKTVGLGTTSTANAPSHPIISATESKWYDGAAYFDDGDYATTPAGTDFAYGTGDYTVEVWVYPTNNTGVKVIFSQSVSGTNYFVFATNSGTLQFYSTLSGGGTPLNAKVLPLNTWSHAAITRQSGVLRIFVDGVLMNSVSNTLDLTDTTRIPTIGKYTHTTDHWNGYLQDLKIYKGFAKYSADFTPPQPICGFTTDLAIQSGFTTTSATGALLSSVVGLGSTSTLAFGADQTYSGITSITSSSGITTLPDTYAQNLVLALPLANITGVGNSFTNDRNTQIRTASITGAGVTAGTTKTITNTGVSTVSLGSTSKWYGNTAFFNGTSNYLSLTANGDFGFSSGIPFTIEGWFNAFSLSSDGGGGDGAIFGNREHIQANSFTVYIGSSTTNTIGVHVGGSVLGYFGYGEGLSTNRWYHFALIRNSSNQLNFYVNGNLCTNTLTQADLSNTNFYIGCWGSGRGAFFDGYIQDLRIYKGTAKYTTNFTPPPPMFGDYTRSTPNKIVFTPGSDYELEARNTATGGIVTSVYSTSRQWGTKPEGGIYDPFASNLVLAIPGGAVGGATSTFDVTGQIRFETPTTSFVNAGIVTYSNSLGIGTYGNRTVSIAGTASVITTQSKYYGRSMFIPGSDSNTIYASGFTSFSYTSPFTMEFWLYPISTTANNHCQVFHQDRAGVPGTFSITYTNTFALSASGTTGSYTITQSQWQHIAYSRDVNGDNRLFVNGVQVLSGKGTFYTAAGYEHFMMGKRLVTDGFTGRGEFYIQDVRVYLGVAKYTSNFTPPNQIYLT